MRFDKSSALCSLHPKASFAVVNDEIQWFDTKISQPTKEQIDAEILRLQTQYDAQEYARKRAPEYPPLTDLADALYHQSKGDETKLTAYLAKCEVVKQKYPKE